MMKKITLNAAALLFATALSAQVYSTGNLSFINGYSGRLDVNQDIVTLTLVGPSTGWLGIAFDASQMDDFGKDVVLFDGTNLSDRTFDGQGVVPPLDAVQNWTVLSNTVTAGVRTVIGTRARDTGDANDYTFSASANSLNIVWARRLNSMTVGYHGGGSCGATVANFTLSNAAFEKESFQMSPNPANGFTHIELPDSVTSGELKMYDNLGRVVKKQTITHDENTVHTSDLPTGSYMVVVRTQYGNATKQLLVK